MKARNSYKIYRELLLNIFGNQCARCKNLGDSKNKLSFHHKDRDITNNVMENIELLCSTCHGDHHALEVYVETIKHNRYSYGCKYCYESFSSFARQQAYILKNQHEGWCLLNPKNQYKIKGDLGDGTSKEDSNPSSQ